MASLVQPTWPAQLAAQPTTASSPVVFLLCQGDERVPDARTYARPPPAYLLAAGGTQGRHALPLALLDRLPVPIPSLTLSPVTVRTHP